MLSQNDSSKIQEAAPFSIRLWIQFQILSTIVDKNYKKTAHLICGAVCLSKKCAVLTFGKLYDLYYKQLASQPAGLPFIPVQITVY